MKDVSFDPAGGMTAVGVTWAYAKLTAAFGIVYLVLNHFWSRDIELTINQLKGQGLVWSGLGRVWFIFALGVAFMVVIMAVIRPRSYLSRIDLIVRGMWVSVNAGAFEELTYRVFGFLGYMAILSFFNWFSFGFVGWLSVHIFIPFSNFISFHALDAQLTQHGWVIGVAIIAAAGSFSTDALGNGLPGRVSSWFLGMAFFWLMFNYGLLTAIAAHVLYNVLVFMVVGLMTRTDR